MMELAPSRLAPGDVLRVGAVGLSARKLRAALSGLGIAIGIAAMVAVLAISESSKADLLSSLDRLGTNLLTVSPGQSIFGEDATLPDSGARDGRPDRPGRGGLGHRGGRRPSTAPSSSRAPRRRGSRPSPPIRRSPRRSAPRSPTASSSTPRRPGTPPSSWDRRPPAGSASPGPAAGSRSCSGSAASRSSGSSIP